MVFLNKSRRSGWRRGWDSNPQIHAERLSIQPIPANATSATPSQRRQMSVQPQVERATTSKPNRGSISAVPTWCATLIYWMLWPLRVIFPSRPRCIDCEALLTDLDGPKFCRFCSPPEWDYID